MDEDRLIWKSFKDGAESALSCIYHQNIDLLFSYGKKFTSDENMVLDSIQDLFYDLIRYREKLGETDNIRFYLLKSFRRTLVRAIEKQKRLSELDDQEFDTEDDRTFSAEERFIETEESTRQHVLLRKGLRKLNAKQRELFYYKFTLGYDYPQICELMSISYDSARQLVSRGLSTLKTYVNKQGETGVSA
ncbi:MAG: RNA polymerase sigma factor [Dysgonamonadaceae bacterium]|jgi:RNA polymerase sigma factor (sigma-70 family)|nr:RNA polymerase sigma factor [Dysgonamonadaceae bacterium]